MGNRERNFIIGLANPEVNPQSSLPLSGFTLPAPPPRNHALTWHPLGPQTVSIWIARRRYTRR